MKSTISGIITIVFLLLNLHLNAQCLEGDCIDGFGKFKCDCGYVFEGEFKDGEKVKGTLTKKNLVYTGEFKNDVAHGHGIMCYKDGSCYEGTFVNNEFSGYGVYTFKNKFTYIGEFENGFYKGLGIKFQMNKKGDTTAYECGEFENDVLNGVGIRSYTQYGFEFGEIGEKMEKGFAWKPVKGDSSFVMAIYYNSQTKESAVFDTINTEYVTHDSIGYKIIRYNHYPQIVLEIKDMESTKYYYTDYVKGLFFVSSEEDPWIGKVINTKGEIFVATLSLDGEITLLINNQLYNP